MKTLTDTKRRIEPWSVKKLISFIDSGELDLDTEYQRENIVWDKTRKQLLIDSILHDIDIPKIYYAYFTDDKHYECVDGKQRITSILDFYNNAIRLESGEFYSNTPNISKTSQSDFLDYEFMASVIINPTDEAISELFSRLNIGKALNGGELIHAMRGEMRDFIFEKDNRKSMPFISKLGIKSFRFSREIAFSQMLINSILFRTSSMVTHSGIAKSFM